MDGILTHEDQREREDIARWETLKSNGSAHYKTGGTEPIDLYRAGGMFRDFALCSIIKYAFRNRSDRGAMNPRDLDKIIDYAKKLKATVAQNDSGRRGM